MSKKILIVGAGGIGEATALLLREWATEEVEIVLADISEETLQSAKEFVTDGSVKSAAVETLIMADETSDEMRAAFEQCDILLDCSPGAQAPRMARFARDFKMHYANLTEYVAETNEITKIANGAETGFILQTGLAPGFINVLAMSLYQNFVAQYENESVERIAMKVGALSAHAHSPFFYGFTWSPIGVATEYIKDSVVVVDGEITTRPARSARERIIIDGRTYEADLTSGGAADLPDFFTGKAKNLDYKTLRYIGHYDWVDQIVAGLPQDENLVPELEKIMLERIPSVEEDVVLVHASVDGFDSKGRRRMLEKAYRVDPLEINGKHLRAIQTTTSVPLCETAMMLLSDKYSGVVLQSQIDPTTFINGSFVSKIYK
jgi:saccharopine dehydrogenase-like NADP-dependent oxidoreductase